jgi:hypothetical protein
VTGSGHGSHGSHGSQLSQLSQLTSMGVKRNINGSQTQHQSKNIGLLWLVLDLIQPVLRVCMMVERMLFLQTSHARQRTPMQRTPMQRKEPHVTTYHFVRQDPVQLAGTHAHQPVHALLLVFPQFQRRVHQKGHALFMGMPV